MATLKDEKVMESWFTLIEDSAGRSADLLSHTKNNLETVQAPNVRWRTESVKPGLFKGLMGKQRDFLMVTNSSLPDHRMYIGARDYGTYLSVSWFVTAEPGYFKKKLSSAVTGLDNALSFALDLFDQEELRAYVSVSHQSLLKAVNELMDKLGQDYSKINTKSKGFLEVW